MIKHLLSIDQLSREDVIRILDTAESFREVGTRVIKKVPALRGRTVVNLFYENSTRTRISFELAAKRLSADVINFSTSGSSVAKGESLKDTALTLQAMGADAIVIRHSSSGAPYTIINYELTWRDLSLLTSLRPDVLVLDEAQRAKNFRTKTAATLRARLALALRLAMVALLVLGLLGAGLPQTVDRQATVFVADVSASVSDAQPELAAFISQAVAAKTPDDAYAVVTTARNAAVAQDVSRIALPFSGALAASASPSV